jgi:hypothetical protein
VSPLVRIVLSAGLVAVAPTIGADPWEFEEAVDVTRARGPGIFHHLESSGRRNVAVSGDTVAVAWEDDRDGTPRIYLARKRVDASGFEGEILMSGEAEAFEPSLAALGGNRFIVAWEEDGRVHARILGAQGLGPTTVLDGTGAAQANVSVWRDRVYLLYAQRRDRFSGIRLDILQIDAALELAPETSCAVDAATLQDDQLYPAAEHVADELIVAWEDRRPGHTIIMASTTSHQTPCRFLPPARISERREGEPSSYGKGHGVSRVAIGGFDDTSLVAAWTDKRSYWEGYDIYAARYLGDGSFGTNAKVQDEFGDFARQWHVAVAGNAGRTVIAWTDEREGNSDIMLSWNEDGEWSEDLPLPGASDAAHQSHPGIAMDASGNLHAAWIERAETNGPTRLRYQFGRAEGE